VRPGRLVAPDMGFGEDTEAELVAEDVGISGGAASAEEAAIHIIDNGGPRSKISPSSAIFTSVAGNGQPTVPNR
jgi:hypothetical protein